VADEKRFHNLFIRGGHVLGVGVTNRLQLKEAVVQVVTASGAAGLTVDQIVAAARLLPCCEPIVRDDVASVLKALVKAEKVERRGGPLNGGGGYRYHAPSDSRR
jgi:hypothetical protein